MEHKSSCEPSRIVSKVFLPVLSQIWPVGMANLKQDLQHPGIFMHALILWLELFTIGFLYLNLGWTLTFGTYCVAYTNHWHACFMRMGLFNLIFYKTMALKKLKSNPNKHLKELQSLCLLCLSFCIFKMRMIIVSLS